MADWNKLNKELDDALNKMTDSEWNDFKRRNDEKRALSQHDVSKRKFAIEWMRNVNYGIGSGTEYFNAETREEALRLFWNGKNKEAFEVNNIYVC